MEMTGKFNQVPRLPENWSGSAVGMGALAVRPAGVATTSLVCMLCGALSPGREVSKGSLIIPLHLFLLRLLVNPLWLALFIL